MRTKNKKTNNGKVIKNLKKVGNQLVGLVDNQILLWNLEGRRSKNRKSKLDIASPKEKVTINQVEKYVIVRKWGNNYKYSVAEKSIKGHGIVKSVKVLI